MYCARMVYYIFFFFYWYCLQLPSQPLLRQAGFHSKCVLITYMWIYSHMDSGAERAIFHTTGNVAERFPYPLWIITVTECQTNSKVFLLIINHIFDGIFIPGIPSIFDGETMRTYCRACMNLSFFFFLLHSFYIHLGISVQRIHSVYLARDVGSHRPRSIFHWNQRYPCFAYGDVERPSKKKYELRRPFMESQISSVSE